MTPRYLREAVVVYQRGQKTLPTTAITSSATAAKVLRKLLPETPQERFVVLGLDNKNKTLGWTLIGLGGTNYCVVDLASVFRWAILAGVAAIILAHNHPSGDIAPSPEDIELTRRIKEASDLLGIRLLDHIVLGDTEYYSFMDEIGAV